jgi:hypothetical protein
MRPLPKHSSYPLETDVGDRCLEVVLHALRRHLDLDHLARLGVEDLLSEPAHDQGRVARHGVGCMVVHTIELTDEELKLVRAALHSYLEDFGHEEADVLRAVKAVLAKLPAENE